MNTLSAEQLYELLPAIHRIRDAQQGEPLKALLALFAEELTALEEDLEQLYDDQFIETCAPWVAPYIGDLIGYRPLHGVSPAIASPRGDVANTIRNRRRKGTALMLEELARDVTNWPAHAAEFFEQLATTQYMNHLRPRALATAPARDLGAMLARGGAFNRVAHTAELRRPESGAGRYNIPNVGIFLWRLLPLSITRVPLTAHDGGGRRFRVNPLGADLQLFRLPRTETTIDHLSEPVNVPAALRIRELALQVRAASVRTALVSGSDDVGRGRSLVLESGSTAIALNEPDPAVPGEFRPVLRIADLRDLFDGGGGFVGWAHEDDIADHEIALDPERGRVLLGAQRAAEHAASPFIASFHHGLARALGGGEYERTPEGETLAVQRSAGNTEALQPHLNALATGGRLLIRDSLRYAQTPVINIAGVTAPNAPGHQAVLGAANGARPLIAAGGDIVLNIGARGTLTLDGLVISGGALTLAAAADNEPRTLILRDCTLVPGLALHPDGRPVSAGAPSLVIAHPFTKLVLQRCIVGPMHVVANSDVEVELRDCIVDAGADTHVAYAGDAGGGPGAQLTLRECTVIGNVHTRVLKLASNTIFVAQLAAGSPWPAALIASRRQTGCVRFCDLPPGAITPRKHRCVSQHDPGAPRPHFASLRYGNAAYGQLRSATPKSIRQGADDDGEMGVMHALFQPQRETNLRIRLDEYLRFGLHAGIFYAT
jgi:hypothetical protein